MLFGRGLDIGGCVGDGKQIKKFNHLMDHTPFYGRYIYLLGGFCLEIIYFSPFRLFDFAIAFSLISLMQ